MAKIYEFYDKHYCEKDLSETDELYAGDLDDMWEAMKDSCYFYEATYYCTDEYMYEDLDELFKNECDCIGEIE